MAGVIPIELQRARYRLARERPYIAAALWRLVPVERPGLGTLAVDMYWRLYYDPAAIRSWTTEGLMAVLMHEVEHLLRRHSERLKRYPQDVANLAADAEINDGQDPLYKHLPGQPVTPEALNLEPGKLAEEYANALLQERTPVPGQGGEDAKPSDGGDAGNGTPSEGGGTGTEAAGSRDQGTGGSGQTKAEGTAGNPPGNGTGSEAMDSDRSAGDAGPDGDGGTGSPSQSTGRGGAGDSTEGGGGGSIPSSPSSQSPTPSRGPTDPVPEGGIGGTKAGSAEDVQGRTPAPGAGRCGSCATGRPEPWEEGKPQEAGGTSEVPGVTGIEAELIRRTVAQAIREHSRTRGDIPAGLARWAEEVLRPRVDWRRVLATEIRRALGSANGRTDYTWRKPSRRQSCFPNIVLPGMHHPTTSIAVVVDTSGSISDEMLNEALAEVRGILDAQGRREAVHVIACDAEVHAVRRVFDARRVRKLPGGGGTDMGRGIAAAMRLRPRPEVIVVITDGFTPWPEEPPRGTTVIVALLDPEGSAPSWARKVVIEG